MKSCCRSLFVLAASCFVSLSAHAAAFTLNINVSGSGTVNRNPTNSSYPEGSVVILTATPAANWTFAGWSGDASGSANPLNVTMNSNKTITATFTPLSVYALTLATNGAGTISVNPPTNSFPSNSTVQLQATPASGWLFGSWSGDAGDNTNPLTILMNSNKSIAANFVQPPQITAQPRNAIVLPGETASFSVGAAGSAPLIYYWRFNGAPLSQSPQPTLTLTNVQTAQAGNYSVLVSNAYGTAISSNARLDIVGGCIGSNVVSDCTEAGLRAAVARGGIVRLCCNGTITLSNTIEITNNVALDANGRNVVISGNNAVRLFTVSSNASFTATNLILADGVHRGTNGANGGLLQTQIPSAGEPGKGGAIYNNGGTVLLVSCVLSNNQALGGKGGDAAPGPGVERNSYPGQPGRGGAICSDGGTVRLVSSLLVTNRVMGGDGGLRNNSGKTDSPAANGEGGAVFVTAGLLRFESSSFIGNAAKGGVSSIFTNQGVGHGGAIYVRNATVAATNCVLLTNQVEAPLAPDSLAFGKPDGARGGGIYVNGGSLALHGCTLAANASIGISVIAFGSTAKPPPAYGGAMYVETGSVQVVSSTFRGNVAQGGNAIRFSGTGEARGGAIFSAGQLIVSRSSLSENRALSGSFSSGNADGYGGALYNVGTAIVESSTFDSNVAKGGDAGAFGTPTASYPGGHAFGGAIFNESILAITNSTLAANLAQAGKHSGTCCGTSGSAYGGGIHSATGSVQLMNVTIASNTVTPGAQGTINNGGLALGANVSSTNGTVTLRNSLLAYGGTNGNAWGAILDGGFNMSSDGSIALNSGSSFSFTDPKLGPLQDNGGPTPTMALLPGSPAIDFGGTNGAPTDQRGFPRPSGSGVDIGAFEVQPSGPVLSASRGVSNSFTLSFTAEAGLAYEIHSSSDLVSWPLAESIGPSATNGVVTRTYSTSGQFLRFYRLELR